MVLSSKVEYLKLPIRNTQLSLVDLLFYLNTFTVFDSPISDVTHVNLVQNVQFRWQSSNNMTFQNALH
jgi:hypothetical protein